MQLKQETNLTYTAALKGAIKTIIKTHKALTKQTKLQLRLVRTLTRKFKPIHAMTNSKRLD